MKEKEVIMLEGPRGWEGQAGITGVYIFDPNPGLVYTKKHLTMQMFYHGCAEDKKHLSVEVGVDVAHPLKDYSGYPLSKLLSSMPKKYHKVVKGVYDFMCKRGDPQKLYEERTKLSLNRIKHGYKPLLRIRQTKNW